jgi:N-acylneuraminate cytidylyltransferase
MYAFIFARSGSKRLKNKNLRLIKGRPLIYYSINIAKKIKQIKDIYVSTDSKKIANIAKKFGAKVIVRPKSLANSKSVEYLSWKHAVKFLEKKKITIKKFISLPCTAPLRNLTDIKKCINKLKGNNHLVITGYKNYYNTQNIAIHKSKEGKFFFKNKKNINSNKNYKILCLTSVAYVTTPEYIKNNKELFDGDISVISIPKIRAIDINDLFDFKIAKMLIEKK